MYAFPATAAKRFTIWGWHRPCDQQGEDLRRNGPPCSLGCRPLVEVSQSYKKVEDIPSVPLDYGWICWPVGVCCWQAIVHNSGREHQELVTTVLVHSTCPSGFHMPGSTLTNRAQIPVHDILWPGRVLHIGLLGAMYIVIYTYKDTDTHMWTLWVRLQSKAPRLPAGRLPAEQGLGLSSWRVSPGLSGRLSISVAPLSADWVRPRSFSPEESSCPCPTQPKDNKSTIKQRSPDPQWRQLGED